jgi:hypothetical protein
MNPVLAACQLVNVSKPGSEPELGDGCPEDIRLMLPNCVVRAAWGQGAGAGGRETRPGSRWPRALQQRESAAAHSLCRPVLAVIPPPPGAPPSLIFFLSTQDDKGRPLAADKRRKWCDVPANVEGAVFDTE